MPKFERSAQILKWITWTAVFGCFFVSGIFSAKLAAQPAAKATPVGKAETQETLDLETCYKLSAVRSDTLAMSEQDIQAANARYQQAVSALFPTINFTSQQFFQ